MRPSFGPLSKEEMKDYEKWCEENRQRLWWHERHQTQKKAKMEQQASGSNDTELILTTAKTPMRINMNSPAGGVITKDYSQKKPYHPVYHKLPFEGKQPDVHPNIKMSGLKKKTPGSLKLLDSSLPTQESCPKEPIPSTECPDKEESNQRKMTRSFYKSVIDAAWQDQENVYQGNEETKIRKKKIGS